MGVLLCRQAAEIFLFGHACVLQGLPKCRYLALSSRTRRAEAVCPPSPAHPLSSFSLCTPGTTGALCTLCCVGRNTSCVVPVVQGWEDGGTVDGPAAWASPGFNNHELLNLEL